MDKDGMEEIVDVKYDNYTLDDIAHELGLNKSTVSRAISGKGRIGKATRDKVLSFVKQQNYTPNIQAKGLATGKTYNLCMIFPLDYAETDIQFFRDCMRGITGIAEHYNYDVLIVFASNQNPEPIKRIISNRKADGFVIGRSVENSSTQRLLRESGLPFVIIGHSDYPEIYSVDNPNREACMELTEIMLAEGARRLALFGGEFTHWVSKSRYQGFADAHARRGEEVIPALLFPEIDTYQKAMKAVRQTMETGADGILCMDDFIANLVLKCLYEDGISVPQQIRLASFYDSRELENNLVPVTSIHFDSIELGKNACLALLEQLGEQITEEPARLNYQIILRRSTDRES